MSAELSPLTADDRPAAPAAESAPSLGRRFAAFAAGLRPRRSSTDVALVPAGDVGEVLAQQQQAPVRAKTARERRWERRRRRIWLEEVVGWVLVPVILVALYWGVVSGLEAFGTSPSALWDGFQTVLAAVKSR